MVDVRESSFADLEEALRSAFDGFQSSLWTAAVGQVTQDSDGHTVQAKITIKGQTRDAQGKLQHTEYPVLQDMPVHYAGGGGTDDKSTVITHPVSKGKDGKTADEGLIIFAARPIDSWHASGDVQNAQDLRMHDLSDGVFVPGVRSTPRKLKNVSTDATHVRSVDARHTHEVHPTKGMTAKSVDSSDKADDPFNKAKKFYHSIVQAAAGVQHLAADGDTKHQHSLTHDAGHIIDVANGVHKSTVHPTNGAAMSAANGTNTVSAHPTAGSKISGDNGNHFMQVVAGIGAKIKSSIAHLIDAPNASLDAAGNFSAAGSISSPVAAFATAAIGGLAGLLNVGGGASSGVGAGAMQTGAAAANVGALSGVLAGTLPAPTFPAPLIAYSAVSNTSGFTASAANLSGGMIEVVLNLTGTLAAGATMTLPTVAALLAAMPFAGSGYAYRLRVKNTSGGAFSWTVGTNTGWTLNGTMTIAQNTQREFVVTFTSPSAATLQSLGGIAVTAV